MSKETWGVLVSALFAIVTSVTPIPERWKPIVVSVAWILLLLCSLGWLSVHFGWSLPINLGRLILVGILGFVLADMVYLTVSKLMGVSRPATPVGASLPAINSNAGDLETKHPDQKRTIHRASPADQSKAAPSLTGAPAPTPTTSLHENIQASNQPKDLRETLSRLSQGWTLHRIDGKWSLYLIMDRDQISGRIDVDTTEIDCDSSASSRAEALWKEVRGHVIAPRPLQTELGEIKGDRRLVEHLSHEFRKPTILTWTFEGQDFEKQRFEPQPIDQMSPEARRIIEEFDALSTRMTNRRYIDALIRVTK